MNIYFGTPTNSDLLEINDKIVTLKNEYDLIPENPSNELKRSFYNLQINILLSFYYQSCSLVLWEIFAKNKEAFPSSTHNVYLIGMIGSIENHDSVRNLINSNNRSILIDSWSMFETTITQLCDKYITDDILEDFLSNSENYQKVEKALDGKLDEKDKMCLKSKFKFNKISAQSIENRYRKLYALFFGGDYKEKFKDELAFLKFYLTIRNCMHHNFIYLNKDNDPYSYLFQDIKIEFINGEAVKFTPDTFYTFFFELTLKLISITNDLFVLIDKKSK